MRGLKIGVGLATVLGIFACTGTNPIGMKTERVSGAACSTPGETAPAADGCNDCDCTEDKKWVCTDLACEAGGCTYGGETHADGDQFPSTDGCNSCSCVNGQVACTDRACAPCEDGDTKPAGDDCNTCGCLDGQWVCTIKACADGGASCEGAEQAVRDFLADNKACETDLDCKQDVVGCGVTEDGCTGAVYVNEDTDAAALEALRSSLAACVTGGGVSCGVCDRATARAACVAGQCTNTGNGASCDYNGKTYPHGQGFTSADGCNGCFCDNGTAVCTTADCPCTGDECDTCTYGSVEYASGDHWDCDCNICTCNDGVIGSTMAACGCDVGDTKLAPDLCNTCTCTERDGFGDWSCTDRACGFRSCDSDSDCPDVDADCEECADGSSSCPVSVCQSGVCQVVTPTCTAQSCTDPSDCPDLDPSCVECEDGTMACESYQCYDYACVIATPVCAAAR